MTFFELFQESTTTLTVNRLRTGLAVLGIVIGIGSVITLISLGQSSQKSIQNQIQSLGANLLTISPGSTRATGTVGGGLGSGTTLTNDDAIAIATDPTVTEVTAVSAEYSGRSQVVAGRNNTNATVIGVQPSYADVHEVTMDSGTFITDANVSSIGRVAVLGPTMASTLFTDGSDPVGQTVRINNQSMLIIGVTTAKGGSGFQNPDNSVYVPLSTAQKVLFGNDYLTSIAVEAKDQNDMTDAENQIGYLLLTRHHLTDPTDADFSIFSQDDILNTADQVTGTFTAMLGGVAAISLLVGGIGIMNIMLVTVTERTREIGLRQALGAKKKIIIGQFLMEAVLLTIIGGLIGLVFGLIGSFALAQVLSLPVAVDPTSIALAIVVSAVIGVVFGWYPAQQAAKLQPIEALRYE